jgi:hypothetical protein
MDAIPIVSERGLDVVMELFRKEKNVTMEMALILINVPINANCHFVEMDILNHKMEKNATMEMISIQMGKAASKDFLS